MKKLFVSAGLVAVGAAAFESAFADNVSSPKYWSVSGTLRGFYDDNYNLTSANQESFGIELLPSVSFHMPLQQTDIGLRYTYGAYYYQKRQDLGLDPFDQSHQLDLWVDHAFNERWRGRVNDTFAAAQQPQLELLFPNPGGITPTTQTVRFDGDNISNNGGLALTTDWTRQFSTVLSYNNVFYDFRDSGATLASFLPGGSGATLAGLLDSVYENVSLDLQWHITPETTALVGYQFSWINYTGNEPIWVNSLLDQHPGFVHHSSDRDYRSQYGYVGIQQQFTPNLNAAAKIGANYTDSYADPINPNTSWTPYADASISYTYLPGSYVQLGVTHDINATDVVAPDAAGNITQYQEGTVVYLNVNQRFTPKLIGTAIGRVQYSTFQGGLANNSDETYYSLGFNLSYEINQFLSVDAGYNYDNVQASGAGTAGFAYNRNRVYLGVTATY